MQIKDLNTELIRLKRAFLLHSKLGFKESRTSKII